MKSRGRSSTEKSGPHRLVLPGDLDQAEAEAFVEAHGGVLAQDAEAERRVALTAGVLDQCCEERGPHAAFPRSLADRDRYLGHGLRDEPVAGLRRRVAPRPCRSDRHLLRALGDAACVSGPPPALDVTGGLGNGEKLVERRPGRSGEPAAGCAASSPSSPGARKRTSSRCTGPASTPAPSSPSSSTSPGPRSIGRSSAPAKTRRRSTPRRTPCHSTCARQPCVGGGENGGDQSGVPRA